MGVLVVIGIGLIMLGIGLFIGKIMFDNDMSKDNGSIFSRWINQIKDGIETKKQEKEFRKALNAQARKEALLNMKPELVKYMKDKEMKKLTGDDKKEKLEKFANMFSMGGNGFDSNKKLNNMLGVNNQNYNQNYNDNYNNQNYNQNYNESSGTTYRKPKRRKTTYRQSRQKPQNKSRQSSTNRHINRNQQRPQQQSSQTFSMDKIDKMLGNKNNNDIFSDDKISMMLGKTKSDNDKSYNDKSYNDKSYNDDVSTEDKIKKILS